jgi:hypothetical protein
MRHIDMSASAVTARLRLVSELRRLCLSLGAAKIYPQPTSTQRNVEKLAQETRKIPK